MEEDLAIGRSLVSVLWDRKIDLKGASYYYSIRIPFKCEHLFFMSFSSLTSISNRMNDGHWSRLQSAILMIHLHRLRIQSTSTIVVKTKGFNNQSLLMKRSSLRPWNKMYT